MSEIQQTIGQRLKAAREKRGMSAPKVADEIHLDAWVIEALESGDYAKIGPAVYAKGHLKRYAELVGLPSAEIVAGYDPEASPLSVAAQPGSSVRMRTADAAGSEFPWIQMAGFALLALLVAGVIWWRPWHPRAAPTAESTSVPAPQSETPPAASPAGAASPNAAAAPATVADSTGAPAVVAAPPPVAGGTAAAAPTADSTEGVGRARLRLSFSADAFVDVHDAAGRRVFSGTGRANSVKTIAGDAPLRVYLKSASGVQLEINNHAVAIGPQFMAGDVARFEAGADGVLRREARPRG